MKEAGATSMLCVNITRSSRPWTSAATRPPNLRRDGPDRADRPGRPAAGIAQITATLQSDPSIDGVLPLGAGVFPQSMSAIKQANSSAKIGTFDVTKDITAGVKDGSVAFAIDQQPYIQGYQAVDQEALLVNKNLLIGGGTSPIASGPRVLTQDNIGRHHHRRPPLTARYPQSRPAGADGHLLALLGGRAGR